MGIVSQAPRMSDIPGSVWLAILLVPATLALFFLMPLIALGFILVAACAALFTYFPVVGIVGLFLVAPWQNSVLGSGGPANISPADCVAFGMLVSLPFIAIRHRRIIGGLPIVPVTLFLMVGFISSMIYWDGRDSIVSLARMLFVTLIAMLFCANYFDRKGYAGAFVAYCFSSCILALAVIFIYVTQGSGAAQYAFGMHKNALGPTFGVAVVICLAYLLSSPKVKYSPLIYVALAISLSGLMLTLSRGAWVATGIAYLYVLIVTKNIRYFIASLVIIVIMSMVLWAYLPEDSREYASDISIQSYTINERIQYMGSVMEAFRESPLIGVGVGLRKSVEPHNVVVLTLGETGSIGLLFFLLMIVSSMYLAVKTKARLQGYKDMDAIIVVSASVYIITIAHGLMDVYWRRGVGIIGWACVGMIIAINHQVRTRLK